MKRIVLAVLAAGALFAAAKAEAIDFTPTATIITVTYKEPTTNTDGSAINDLLKTTINSRVCPAVGTCSSTFTSVDVPASAPTGGGNVSKDITQPVAPGQERVVEVF